MALSGAYETRVGSTLIYVRTEWSATQNSAARTSTITARLYLHSKGSGATISTGNSRAVSLNIGGNVKSGTANFTLSSNQKKLLLTHTRTLTHNSAGNLSAAISGTTSFNGLMGYSNITASGTAVLDSLGAADLTTGIKLNKSTWKVHTHLTYALDRKKSKHNHRIEIRVNGNLLKTISNAPLSGSLPQFTPDEWKSFYDVLNGRTDPSQLTMDVRVYTYNGSTFIGTRSAQTSIIGTEPSKPSAANIDLRDMDRAIQFTHDPDAPRTLRYFTSETLLKHVDTNVEYGWVDSVPGNGLENTLWYNIKSPYENSGFDLKAIADVSNRSGFYWETRTYYRGSKIGPTQRSATFNISLTGMDGLVINHGFMSFTDLDGLYPFPTLVRNISRPRFSFDWSKVEGNVASAKLTIGTETQTISRTADTHDWGLYLGGGTATIVLTNEYGIESNQTIMVSERAYPTLSAQVRAQRQGFSDEVRVTFSGTLDTLNGKNKVLKVEIKTASSSSWSTVSFTQNGNGFNSTSFTRFTVPLDASETFQVRITSKYNSQIFTASVAPAKPLFYIGEEDKNIGLGKYPREGNMVDSEYPIHAPSFNFSDYVSLTSISNGLRVNNGVNYMDIGATSSYIQFSTNKARYYFDKEVIAESSFRSSGIATFNSDVVMSRNLSVDGTADIYTRLDVRDNAAVEGHLRVDKAINVGWESNFASNVNVTGKVSSNGYDIKNGVSYTRFGNSPVVRGGESSSTIYLQAGVEVRAVKPLTTATYVPVRASSHPTASSILYKQNVEDLTEEEANRLLDSLHVKTYHLNSDVDSGIYDKIKIGLINEMTPAELRDEDGIDSYSVASLAVKQTQMLKARVEELERLVSELSKLI